MMVLDHLEVTRGLRLAGALHRGLELWRKPMILILAYIFQASSTQM